MVHSRLFLKPYQFAQVININLQFFVLCGKSLLCGALGRFKCVDTIF